MWGLLVFLMLIVVGLIVVVVVVRIGPLRRVAIAILVMRLLRMSRHDRELLVDDRRELFSVVLSERIHSKVIHNTSQMCNGRNAEPANHLIKCDGRVTHFYVWPMSLGIALSIEDDDGTSTVMYLVQKT